MKRPLVAMAAFAGLCLMGACTAGPDYTAPDVNAPDTFVSQDVLERLNSDKADAALATDWWEGFEDETLNGLVEAGIENNYEIAAAMARLQQAEAEIRLADAGDNLDAEAGAEGGISRREVMRGTVDDVSTVDLSGVIGLILPVDVSGRTRRSVEAARAGLESAMADLNGVVLGISADIVSEYLRLRGNQRQLELLRESVALQEKTLSIVTSRYKAGLSPELDVRRAETSVENLRADIPSLEQALLNSRNRLAALTGQYPGAYEELLNVAGDSPDYTARIPGSVPLDVLNARPDIRAAEADLKQAIAGIGVAEGEFYPALELAGQISISSTGVTGTPSTDVLIGSLAALISQVVIDDGSRKAGVDIAKAEAREALADYEQALRVASEEVEQSLAAIRASLDRQESLQKAVKSSARSFHQAEILYQQGLISFLDVVDAQRVLASAEQQLAREQTNYATQIATLFRVMGADVTPPEAAGAGDEASSG